MRANRVHHLENAMVDISQRLHQVMQEMAEIRAELADEENEHHAMGMGREPVERPGDTRPNALLRGPDWGLAPSAPPSAPPTSGDAHSEGDRRRGDPIRVNF